MFCHEARKRIDQNFATLFDNYDEKEYRVVQDLMKGEYNWLEGRLIQPSEDGMPTSEQIEEAIRQLA